MSPGSSEPRSNRAIRSILAGLVDLLRLEARPARRQLEHPVRPAGLARRQRGRSSRQAGGLGTGASATGKRARSTTAAGPTRPTRPIQTASMTCAGISSLIIPGLRRFQGQEFLQGERSRTAARAESTAASKAGSTGWPSHFQVEPEFRQRPAMEVLLSLRPGASRPAHGHAVLRPARLVSPGRRGAGPRTEQARRVLGGRLIEARSSPGDQLRAAVPGQGTGAGLDQQAPPRPVRRLEQRPRRRPQHRRASSLATGRAC